MLYWDLAESFRDRIYEQRRELHDLDTALSEAQNRWVRVQRARASVPGNTGDFGRASQRRGRKLAALRERLVTTTASRTTFSAARGARARGAAAAPGHLRSAGALRAGHIYDRAASGPAEAPKPAAADTPEDVPAADVPATEVPP